MYQTKMNYIEELSCVIKDGDDKDKLLGLIDKFGEQRDRFYNDTECLKRKIDYILGLMAEDTGIYVIKKERDCNCVSWTCLEKFDSVEAFRNWEKGVYEYAEGPVSITIISKTEADEFKPENTIIS